MKFHLPQLQQSLLPPWQRPEKQRKRPYPRSERNLLKQKKPRPRKPWKQKEKKEPRSKTKLPSRLLNPRSRKIRRNPERRADFSEGLTSLTQDILKRSASSIIGNGRRCKSLVNPRKSQ